MSDGKKSDMNLPNRPLGLSGLAQRLVLKDEYGTFALFKERSVIGSVASADVRLVGVGIAPIHAVIEVLGGGPAIVYDLASPTGVFVNGTKVVAHPLKPGDQLTIGSRKLVFSSEDPLALPKEDLTPLLLKKESEVEKIFQPEAGGTRALEVVMSWHGTILSVQHFMSGERVSVGGTRRCDFVIPMPATAPSQRHWLVTQSGGEFGLHLDPKSLGKVSGVLQRGGKLHSLTGGSTPISFGDFAKFTIGELDFYLSFTDAPPKLALRRFVEKDPLFHKVLGASMAFTLALILTLLNVHVPKVIEPETLPDRIATILYQPEKYGSNRMVPPAAAPQETVRVDPAGAAKAAKEMDTGSASGRPSQTRAGGQRQAKEGRGARAKGAEGQRGTRNAPKYSEKQDAAMRTAADKGKGRGGGASQAGTQQGNVDLLKGASSKIQDILGSTTSRLGKNGEKLQGFGVFNTQGGQGLALSGDSRGGGGDAATLGGLSDQGAGGGRVGTGKGAAGTGDGIVGGKARVVIRSEGPEEAVFMGAIDRDAVRAAIEAHKDEFRLCYEREINAYNPNLSGTVGTSFVIGSSGRVTRAGIERTTLNSAPVEKCVLGVLKRIQFPTPRGGGIVQIAYPFKFTGGGK